MCEQPTVHNKEFLLLLHLLQRLVVPFIFNEDLFAFLLLDWSLTRLSFEHFVEKLLPFSLWVLLKIVFDLLVSKVIVWSFLGRSITLYDTRLPLLCTVSAILPATSPGRI